MRKRIFRTLVMLVFIALSCGPAAAGESAAAFKDVGSHWAAGDIEKCRVYQLMSGYPDNLFVPDSNLTRAEALAVIGKSLGWDRQAGNVATDGIKYPEDLWEGFRIYITCAADKQLIAKEDISGMKFNEPATRMELVLWLSGVFNLKGSGANLNFNDLGGISASQRDRLAGVVEAGIVKGKPGNLFNPSGNLTRAEMAAILVRLIENGKISPASGGQVAGELGTLTGVRGFVIDKYRDYVTVHIDFGSVEKVRVADVSLLIDGKSTTYGSLRRGSPVELLKSGSAVKAVSILDGVPRIYGKVKQVKSSSIVINDEDGKTAVYDIDKKSGVVDVNGNETDIEGIAVGLNAELFLSDNYSVRTIKLYKSTGRDLQGRVESVDASGSKKITVLESGKRQVFYLAENVSVRDKDGAIGLEEIKKGMDLSLTLDVNESVTGIEIIDLSTVIGKVAIVDTGGADRITIKDRSGQGKSYYTALGVTVTDGSGKLELEDLLEGTDVRLTLDEDGRVTGIEVVDLSTVIGRVNGIRATGARWMAVETDNGREEVYYVDSRAGVSEGSASHGFSFVEEGMRVKLTLNEIGNVASVEIIGIQSVSGVITAIQSSGVKKIALKDGDGQGRAYYLANGAVVRERGRVLNLDDLKIGVNVGVNLDMENRVVAVEVAGQSAVEGEVTSVRAFGAARIDIEKNGGLKEAYYLGNGIKVREGATERSLGEIVKGMLVRITIDDRGNVITVDIIGKTAVEGKVTVSPGRNSRKIGIEKSIGQEEIYDIDDNVLVWEGDSGRELGYIFEDMRVGLLLDGNRRVTRIDILGLHTVRGKVILIQTIDLETRVMVIKEAGGEEKTYNISKNASVSKGSSTLSLGRLNEGMNVEITLNNLRQVSHIEIL